MSLLNPKKTTSRLSSVSSVEPDTSVPSQEFDSTSFDRALQIVLVSQGLIFPAMQTDGSRMWKFSQRTGALSGIKPIDHTRAYSIEEASTAFAEAVSDVNAEEYKAA